MKKIKITVLFLLPFCFNYAQTYWNVIGGDMPQPVSGGQAVFNQSRTNPKFYILGGYSDYFQKDVDWIQEYDILEGKWRFVGTMNTARSSFVANLWDSTIVYFGGANENLELKDALESWNINSQQTPAIYDKKSVFNRKYSTGHISGDNLYIIGGNALQNQSFLSYIAEYNLKDKNVTFTIDFPSFEKPQDYMSFLVNDNIYLFGGVYNGVKKGINKFTISQKKIETALEVLLEPRAGGAAIYNSKLRTGFVLGGYNESKKAMKSVEGIRIQQNGSLTIFQLTDLNYARRNPIIVNYENTIVVFGGYDENGKTVTKIEMYIDPNPPVSVDDEVLPAKFALMQNYPNPFNPETAISYQLSAVSNVQVKVFDMLGREVTTLVNEEKPAGRYQINWNGTDNFGSKVTSGVYFYTLKAGNFVQTKKMILLK